MTLACNFVRLCRLCAALLAACAPLAARCADGPAELVVRNAYVYTADAHDTVAQALAVTAGRIVYVGKEAGLAPLIGPATQVFDLKGRMLLPGLVDARLHPLRGAARASCDLSYAALGGAALQQRIQACLDAGKDEAPAAWLHVTGWLRPAQTPGDADIDGTVLDALKTDRPIVVESTDGHTLLANRRALDLAHLTRNSLDPPDGRLGRDADGNPSGRFEDGATALLRAVLPRASAADNLASASAALDALGRQGITSFLDTGATPAALSAFAALYKRGALTARVYFAPAVEAADAADPAGAVKGLKIAMALYDTGTRQAAPGITVRAAQIRLDGPLAVPARSAALLAPYRIDAGRPGKPNWVEGAGAGPLYLPAQSLPPLLLALARAGIDPHIEANGDRAVQLTLEAAAAVREAMAGADVRVTLGPARLVDPADYARFRKLDVVPVMALQQARPEPAGHAMLGDYLGPERLARLEPAGSLMAAHARVAYGSNWPADPLDPWFALAVAVTRRDLAGTEPRRAARVNAQKPLSATAALRALTIDAAYAVHADADTGSLEVGKLADFIVLDRNALGADPSFLAQIKVLLTVVGGRTVFRDPAF